MSAEEWRDGIIRCVLIVVLVACAFVVKGALG